MVLSHQLMTGLVSGETTIATVKPWREHKRAYRRAQAALDGGTVFVLTLLTGYAIPETFGLDDAGAYAKLLLISAIVAVLAVTTLGLAHAYDTRRMGIGNTQYRAVRNASGIWIIAALAYKALFNAEALTAGLAIWWLSSTLGVLMSHAIVRRNLKRARARGSGLRRAVVVSNLERAQELIESISEQEQTGTVVVGTILDQEPPPRSLKTRYRVGQATDAARLVEQWQIDLVVVSAAAMSAHRLRVLGWELEDLDVELMVAPAVQEVSESRLALQPVAGTALLSMALGQSRIQRMIKQVYDFGLSLIALILLSPLFLIIMVAIVIDTGFPVFFTQTRVGQHGENFKMIKFRTMRKDAEQLLAKLQDEHDGNEVLFKLRHDPRVTRVGRILRRFSLDELPQLFNVLAGNMSLVGPRPPLPREAAEYDYDAQQRLRAKPGMTGLWQVSGRSDLNWDESVRLDIYYADNVSIALDVSILLRTVRAVIGGKGAY